jgi:ribosomal RNA-processing protein 7
MSTSTGKASSSKIGAEITSKPKAATSKPTKPTKGKTTPAKLYSSFIPLPISIPSPLPVPSSSSLKKTLTSTTHYIYARPSSSKTGEEEGRPSDRTIFATNLPVDIGERELRAVFGTFGVIESIEIGREAGGDVLEKAVRGSLENEESDNDDESGEEGEEEEKGEEEGERPEPQFLKTGLTKSQKKRLRRNKGLPPSIPSIIPLPPINPRSVPFGSSGSHIAHIIFLDPISLSKVMSYSGPPISLRKYGDSSTSPTGLEYYTRLHKSLRPTGEAIKSFADSSMDRYDRLHSLLLTSRAKQKGAGALVDEDGFTVVVRGGRYGRTGGRGDQGTGSMGVGVAKRGMGVKELKGGSAELTDFYKFQKVDRKRKGEFSWAEHVMCTERYRG